jgi:hypothetical protein
MVVIVALGYAGVALGQDSVHKYFNDTALKVKATEDPVQKREILSKNLSDTNAPKRQRVRHDVHGDDASWAASRANFERRAMNSSAPTVSTASLTTSSMPSPPTSCRTWSRRTRRSASAWSRSP